MIMTLHFPFWRNAASLTAATNTVLFFSLASSKISLKEALLRTSEFWLIEITLILILVFIYFSQLTCCKRFLMFLRLEDSKLMREKKRIHVAKFGYISQICHELGTPLMVLSLGNEALAQLKSMSPEMAEIITSNEHAIDMMERLRQHVLDATRFSLGKPLTPIPERVNVRDLVLKRCQSVMTGFNSCNPNTTVKMAFIVSEEVPKYTISDSSFLRQMLYSYISNAKKFTEKGSIDVFVSYDEADRRIVFEVSDTGRGVLKENIPLLFSPFSQFQSDTGGAGLALFSVKLKAQALCGHCGYSKREKGSTFWFSIPFVETLEDWYSQKPNGTVVNLGSKFVKSRTQSTISVSLQGVSMKTNRWFEKNEQPSPTSPISQQTFENVESLTPLSFSQECPKGSMWEFPSGKRNDDDCQGPLLSSSPKSLSMPSFPSPPLSSDECKESYPWCYNNTNSDLHIEHTHEGHFPTWASMPSFHPEQFPSQESKDYAISMTTFNTQENQTRIQQYNQCETDFSASNIHSFENSSGNLAQEDNTLTLSQYVKLKPRHGTRSFDSEHLPNCMENQETKCDADFLGMRKVHFDEMVANDKKQTLSERYKEDKKILIVEDDKSVAKMLCRMLSKQGYQVVHAENGAVGLLKMKQQCYLCVFCDLTMPVMDGYTAVRSFRQWEERERTSTCNKQYVCALSANADEQSRTQASRAGFDCFLSKPTKIHVILEHLESLSSRLDQKAL